jgi:Asp/Glu/hydantoin racemase
MTRIVLIHATPAAVEPIKMAFAEAWPQPHLVNLLDDSLSRDRSMTAELTDAMYRRFDALGGYAVSIGADAILFTCSAFGPAIERVARALAVPVLKPNEAMFAEALAIGGRIGMLATFEPSIASMRQELETDAARAGARVELDCVFVPEAMAALLSGKPDQHDTMITDAAAALSHCTAIMLAQFSMASATAALRRRLPAVPILTSPASAVTALRRRLPPTRPTPA